MHAAGLELTKLTYIRLEDNLIRHRGDRLTLTQAKASTRARLRARFGMTEKDSADHLKHRNVFGNFSGTRYDLWGENIAKATASPV